MKSWWITVKYFWYINTLRMMLESSFSDFLSKDCVLKQLPHNNQLLFSLFHSQTWTSQWQAAHKWPWPRFRDIVMATTNQRWWLSNHQVRHWVPRLDLPNMETNGRRTKIDHDLSCEGSGRRNRVWLPDLCRERCWTQHTRRDRQVCETNERTRYGIVGVGRWTFCGTYTYTNIHFSPTLSYFSPTLSYF